jgi:hypothetical protein
MEATATETNQTETQTETAPETVTDTPAAPQTESFDPSKIAPEVKAHFEKEYSTKYADYEPSKQAAAELNRIKNDPAFQEWLQNRNAPQKPNPFEITDDQFTAALTDKAQFTKLVQDAAKHLLANEVKPQLEQTQAHFQFEAKKTELNGVVQKFPDFKDLDKRGLIEPIIRKYPNIGFEDAYWIAKKATYAEDVAKAARGQVDSRKGATVERPNNAPSKNKTVTKVADRSELMERVAQDIREGREPGEYDYD